MVNGTQKFQNASSLNGPIEELIKNVITCKNKETVNYCESMAESVGRGCLDACLFDIYFPSAESCETKQLALFFIATAIMYEIIERVHSKIVE